MSDGCLSGLVLRVFAFIYYDDTLCIVVASNEAVVTQWRKYLQISERRRDDIEKENAAHQMQQQLPWKLFVAAAEELLCTRCPLCMQAFLFEDGCVALKCINDHPGLCWFCCYCDMVLLLLPFVSTSRCLTIYQVLPDSTECHAHASSCPRRPPGSAGEQVAHTFPTLFSHFFHTFFTLFSHFFHTFFTLFSHFPRRILSRQ